MSDKQTLAEAIADAVQREDERRILYERDGREIDLIEQCISLGKRISGQAVQSGEIVTKEMEALAKIEPLKLNTHSWMCPIPSCSAEWWISPDGFAGDLHVDCIWVRARRITGENQ